MAASSAIDSGLDDDIESGARADGLTRVSLGQCSLAGPGKVNQDFHGAILPMEPLLSSKGVALVVADGIGSSAVSQEASESAVHGFLDDYYATSDAWTVRRSAQRVLGATNAWLHAQTLRGQGRFDKDRGYVCTFSALILKGCEVHLLHVGDSRIYRLQGQSLEQLTEDHRVYLSPTESFLGRALGIGANVEIDYRSLPAEVGDIFLLMTDGAYEHLSAEAVCESLARYPQDLDAAARWLLELAQVRGADDDMTVQLLRIDAMSDAEQRLRQPKRADLALPPPLAPRMKFEGYTIVRELHASARSHVFLAVDDACGQQVTLKTPSVDMSGDAAHLDGFWLEEWVARRMHSPHVLKPFATERPRRHVYVAMEYVEGQTLRQWMIDHPRPSLDSVRRIVLQVAKGLQAFHGKEMLHQDLRPDNVMIDRHGTVKIIDFASVHVAGLNEGLPGEPGARAIVGTLQYTAPEYFLGDGGNARSDLFSLAVLTYQMLTSQLPYDLQVPRVRTLADLKRLRYVPVRHLRPDLPQWLNTVLHKALQPKALKRHEAVSEFIYELQHPDLRFERLRAPPLVERNPVVFWQTVALLLGLAVMVLLGLRAHGS